MNTLPTGIFLAFLSSADFFSKLTFSKISFRNSIIISKSLDPDPARRSARFMSQVTGYADTVRITCTVEQMVHNNLLANISKKSKSKLHAILVQYGF